MVVVVMELHSSWKWVVSTKLQWIAPYIRWVARPIVKHPFFSLCFCALHKFSDHGKFVHALLLSHNLDLHTFSFQITMVHNLKQFLWRQWIELGH
jgi:hypothetical protein